MDINHRDDDDIITRLKKNALDRIANQGRGKERDSRADYFAKLAEEFVDQVKALARIDEPKPIGPETSETSKSGSIGRFRLRGIPNQAAKRIVEVLKNEFAISAQEVGQLGIVDENEPQSFGNDESQLRPSFTSAVATRDLSQHRSNNVEMPELNNESIVRSDDLQTYRAETIDESAPSSSPSDHQDDRFNRSANEPSEIMESTSDESFTRTKSRASKRSYRQTTTSSRNSDSPETRARSSLAKSSYHLRKRTSRIRYSEKLDSSEEESDSDNFEPTISESSETGSETEESSEDSSSRNHLDDSAPAKSTRSRRRRQSQSSRSSKPGHSSDETAPGSSETSGQGLWDQKIEQIYQKSASITHFTRNLLFHFFTASELAECYNVYGRPPNGRKEINTVLRPLDPKRVNMIQQLVQQKAGLSKAQWGICVQAMNSNIGRIKSIGYKNTRLERINEKGRLDDLLYPKQNANLKKSPLYKENDLSYKEINEIYRDSQSMPNFALNLLRHFFTDSEFRECYNVYGRPKGNTIAMEPSLDEKRVSLIRRIVDENCDYDKYFWQHSVCRMNSLIRIKKGQSS